jgi:hypothetical protein
MSKTRMCRYECGIELGQFDEENKYREASTGMLHTRERCEAMKNTMRNNAKPAMEEQQPAEVRQQQEPPSLDQIDVRLKRVEKMLFQANSGT